MSDKVIVALDCGYDQAINYADALSGKVEWLKVGMTLFYQSGPRIVSELRQRNFRVFVDLKMHDIPHQVSGAAQALSALGCSMITVHGLGGADMLSAAVEGAHVGAELAGTEPPIVLAITILTSMEPGELTTLGITDPVQTEVARLAFLAQECGTDGVVCSPQEARKLRDLLGPDAYIVTPGVRPSWAVADDQNRIATPTSALKDGASHLVIGRPITDANDPLEALDLINDEISKAGF